MNVGDAAAIVYDRLYQIGKQATHAFGPDPLVRYPAGDRAPVLLLPGVYETWQFLRPIADALYALGHPIHTLPDLGYNRGDIVLSAARAQAYLERHDLHGVIVIAHSKGGIIAKRMMVLDDSSHRIARLVAICSPFGGSSLARFAPTATLRAFHPRNELLLQLAEELEVNERIVSIYSRLDPLIPGGSRLQGALNVELPVVGHFRPLTSKPLFYQLGRVLAEQAGE
jgi:pimeloyl-ACP methyl ester carboxylesterase